VVRLATTLLGGIVGGAVVALVWVSEPEAHASEPMPRLGHVVRAGAATLRDGGVRAAEDEGVEHWKRPTPMEPTEAARALVVAWKQVHGTKPTGRVLSVLWAHWALETGRGRWMVDHNFAGLKGHAPDGGSALWWTWEHTDAGRRRVRTRFRAYPTFEAGARDYVETICRHPQATAAARRGDATAFIEALDRRGYFDEKPSGYARAVEQIARELDTKPFAER
jgi:hypothetical protein